MMRLVPIKEFMKAVEASGKHMQKFMDMELPTPSRISEVFPTERFGFIDFRNGNHELTGHFRGKERKDQKVFQNKNMLFNQGEDSFLLDNYSNVKTAIFHNCEKNFTYYNVNPNVFPNLENLVITNHPCERDVLHRFKNTDRIPERISEKDNVDIYLSDYFYRYYGLGRNWIEDNEENIHNFDKDDYYEWYEQRSSLLNDYLGRPSFVTATYTTRLPDVEC